MISVTGFDILFFKLKKFLSIPSFLRVFTVVGFCQIAFLLLLRWLWIFPFVSLFLIWGIIFFSYYSFFEYIEYGCSNSYRASLLILMSALVMGWLGRGIFLVLSCLVKLVDDNEKFTSLGAAWKCILMHIFDLCRGMLLGCFKTDPFRSHLNIWQVGREENLV